MADCYVIDTNVVIDLNFNQPRDVYPGPWERLEELVNEGRCCMPRMVREELEKIDDYCAPWANGLDGFVVEATDAEILVVAAITAAHPDWVVEQRNAADPWVVACAAERDAVVLTHENMKGLGTLDHNLKIPNVAAEHGLTCIRWNDLARAEGWTFGA